MGLTALVMIVGMLLVATKPASAMGLSIRPLQYNVKLAVGERQKGFVDITNPTPESAVVTTSVQAFRQIDDKGSIQFYTSAAITAGVIPDLQEFALGPRETVRLFFIVDGTKLPSGDVFAAIFATLKPPTATHASTSEQTVRVGTILSIVNGTPGARQADVTQLSLGFWQFDTKISGTYTVKNTADPVKTTGFYPAVSLSMMPLSLHQAATSKLVYAGRSRTNEFQIKTQRFGLYKITAQYGSSRKSTWVFVLSGVWQLVVGASMFTLVAVACWRLYYVRRLHPRIRLKRHV